MSRRLIVGLDGSDYSRNAIRAACSAVQTFGGTVVGVAVIDRPGIEASSRGAGIGAYEFAKRAREHKLSEAREHALAVLDDFKHQCDEAGVACETAFRDVVPFQAIVDVARCADLIVVGLRTYFRFETQEAPGDTLRHLMKVGVCPVLAVPKAHEPPARAVIAYDGSLQAARAMRTYVRLTSGNPQARDITLLYVGEGTEEDEQVQLDEARRYIAGYGFSVRVECRAGEPAEVIEQTAIEQEPCVVVMGAYGRRGIIHELFFGSTAHRLVEHERVPLFVYH